jgi:MFS family permease
MEDKRFLKEAQLRERLEKRIGKKESGWYFVVLFVIIVTIHMIDSYVSDIGSKVQSLYIQDLLIDARGMSQGSALRFVGIIQLIGALFIVVSPFYKVLIDKIGRRPIFIINLFGYSIGAMICYFAKDIWIFIIGVIFIVFFVIHDMQILYIFEVAPKKWRSTLYGATNFIGVLGTLAIPLLRSIYITDTVKNWRPLYLFPGVIGLIVGLISLVFLRESNMFIKSQIDYLATPPDERKKDKKGREEKTSGLIKGLKYMFGNPQMRSISIAMIVMMTAVVPVTAYYEPFMKYSGMSDGKITRVLFIQPFIMSGLYLLCGLIADLIGRKTTMILFALCCLGMSVSFIMLVNSNASPIAIGIVFGFLIGSFWAASNVLSMMYIESTPTEIRGAVTGAQAYVMLSGQLTSLLIYTVLIGFIKLGTFKLIFTFPGLIIAPIIIMLKVKETKGTDLEKVGKTKGQESGETK